MNSLPREHIIEISQQIVDNGDVIALHGTTVENAKKIMETGFIFHRTSYIMLKTKKLENLYNYGWKDNPPGDSTNVIIQIPCDFYKDLLEFDDEQYENWIEYMKNNDQQQNLLDSVTFYEYINNNPMSRLGGEFRALIPKEFVVGAFIWCNNKTYLKLGPDESAADNLNFVHNNNFYCNLSQEEKEQFISVMRKKLGLEMEEKGMRK